MEKYIHLCQKCITTYLSRAVQKFAEDSKITSKQHGALIGIPSLIINVGKQAKMTTFNTGHRTTGNAKRGAPACLRNTLYCCGAYIVISFTSAKQAIYVVTFSQCANGSLLKKSQASEEQTTAYALLTLKYPHVSIASHIKRRFFP